MAKNALDRSATATADGAPAAGALAADIIIANAPDPVFVADQPSGTVTSGSYAPFLQKSIGLAYLPRERSAAGTELAVEIRGRRIGAKVVPTPFYKRPR